jgi:hypothetical protein
MFGVVVQQSDRRKDFSCCAVNSLLEIFQVKNLRWATWIVAKYLQLNYVLEKDISYNV